MEKPNIIYIAGLYHSGTTLIDQYLGSENNIVGLGEVFKFINDGPEYKCTCGKKSKDCEFWGEFINNLNDSSIEDNYSKILSKAFNLFKDKKFILDSSKCHPKSSKANYQNFKGLKFYTKHYYKELKVIHIYRDPRSWVASILRREKRFQRNVVSKLIFNSFFGKILRYIQWNFMHSRIRQYLIENNIQYLNLSYEELCLDKANAIKKISNFLNYQIEGNSLSLSSTSSHICVGNPSRIENINNSEINYDIRWLYERFSLIDFIFCNLYLSHLKKYIYDK